MIKGYDNEKVVASVNANIEVVEVSDWDLVKFTCPECGMEITGLNRNKVVANAKTHMAAKHKNLYQRTEVE